MAALIDVYSIVKFYVATGMRLDRLVHLYDLVRSLSFAGVSNLCRAVMSHYSTRFQHYELLQLSMTRHPQLHSRSPSRPLGCRC